MEEKTSAHYQRLHRQRLREQGLVKKEVWILPEHGVTLQRLEKRMRLPKAQAGSLTLHDKEDDDMETGSHSYWNVRSLAADLKASALGKESKLQVEVLEGADASLLVTLPDFGDLPVHLALSGDQLVVESFLWSASDVADRAGLNEQILRLQKLFPFATIALEPLGAGGEGYVMFAALRSSASSDDILCEILTLADNVIQVTEALASYLPRVAQSA
ncbi:YjfI family protein [Diaphorobacter aerolatus]|uniref:YjfI family protein n=1 Tax=Diaphorobacter aerolatus TaxID=1288495 RepID=A0A7H0GG65_9BURK|nr:YjfI family protein [Diaphorobacter aerolatus]QNP47281.1 YjfI family protein [Diaphorobacter aerolatus]